MNLLEDRTRLSTSKMVRPFNKMMLSKKLPVPPKEKPRPPQRSAGERLLCWARLAMAALLAGGK